MKKIFFILLFFVAAKTAKAQVPDTLAYLQSIVANKTQFIGQPFSRLEDSLKIQIKFFSPNSEIVYDISKETSTHFGFVFPQNAEEMYLTYPHLIVRWQTYLDANYSRTLYKNGTGWTASVSAYYSNGIISDIEILE